MPFCLSTIKGYQDFREISRTKKLKKRSVLKNKLSTSINAFKIFDKNWEKQYSSIDLIEWKDIARVLHNAVENIQIKVVNSSKGSEKLEIPEGLTVYRVKNLREAIEVSM